MAKIHAVLALIAGLPVLHASVLLNSVASPSSGQAGVTVITLMGSGFPSGTIPASNVSVQLKPSVSGAGPSATATATAVQVVLGTTCRVTFQIPVSIVVPNPIAYTVSISGVTSTGVNFSSSNTASLTINPGPQIVNLSPSIGNAGQTVSVTIAGLYTNFVQGATQATFGPGIAVGGGLAGQLGPVTVISPVSAMAQILIEANATPGSQTVTISTGIQQGSLANAFTILPPLTTVNVDTTTTTVFPAGFSGFNMPQLLNGVEFFDPKFVAAIQPMKPGFLRFPSGTAAMAFDWQTGFTNTAWLSSLTSGNPPPVDPLTAYILRRGQKLTQAKGGVFLSDFAVLAKALGASAVICFNGYTDNNPGSAFTMAKTAHSLGLNVREWELANEPYYFRSIFPTAGAYATKMRSYFTGISAGDPTAKVALFFAGLYPGIAGDFSAWDNAMSAYSPRYWNTDSVHLYPIETTVTTGSVSGRSRSYLSASDEQATLNGLLAHGIPQYLASYLPPLVGANTPFFITEFNSDGTGTAPFAGSIFNGIFLAEGMARMSVIPNLQGVAVHALFYGNASYFGMILAADDYEDYLISQVTANPNFSTNTATDPNTQFRFFYSAPGLAMQVTNEAINNSTRLWPTTVAFSPTVDILGFDGQPIPAVYAQGYQGDNGKRYLLVTNKSGSSISLNLQSGGIGIAGPFAVSSISSPDPTANNSPNAQTNVQIVITPSLNPVTVGPYSVTRIEW